MKSFYTVALRRKAVTTMSQIYAAGMWMVADGQTSVITFVSFWMEQLRLVALLAVKVLIARAKTRILLAFATLEDVTRICSRKTP